MSALFKIKNFIAKAMEWICVVIAAALTIVTTGAVFLRYAMDRTFIQQEEAITFMFVAIVFLGAPVVMNAREHVSVTIFQNFLPPVAQKVLTIFQYIAIIAVNVLLIYASRVWIATNMNFLTPGLRIPYWTIYSLLPISCVLSAIIAFIDLLGMLIPGADKKEETV